MRSKDRLGEFMRAAAEGGAGVYCDTVVPVQDTQHQPAPPDTHKDIELIFEEVERARGWVRQLQHNAQLIARLHADATFHTNTQLQEHLDSVVTQSNALGLKASGALRQLQARAGSTGASGVADRIARLQYAATRALYAEALAAHHAALQRLRDDQLHLLRKQIKLTNLTMTDEECQTLLDTNNISIFVDNVAAETAEARRELREVEVRRVELARVEAALADVRDLFQQVASLVQHQQEKIDTVEYYALQTTEHVESGRHQLLKGTVSRNKARKKKMGLVVCLAVGLFLALVVVLYA